jgi:hypothetical protein
MYIMPGSCTTVEAKGDICSNWSYRNRVHRPSLLEGKFKNNIRLKEQAAKRSLAVNYQMNVPGYSETMTRISLVSGDND